MMRVLFTVTNWRGFYFCMVPLGWTLQVLGHEVRVACAPSQVTAIGQAGLIPVPVLGDIDHMRIERTARYTEAVRSGRAAVGAPTLLHPVTGQPIRDLDDYDAVADQAVFQRQCDEQVDRNYQAAVALARRWEPSLVVHDLMSPEGALAAKVVGVPSVCHSSGMFGGADASLHDPTGAFRRHGVEPDRSLIAYMVDPTPDSVVPDHGTALRLPIAYVPYHGPGEMPLWLLDPPARPRVCMVWSRGISGIFGDDVPALRYAIDAVGEQGAELVLAVSRERARTLGQLPGHVRVLPDFPLRHLLPTCDAIVHQGSADPIIAAAATGIPQLALGLTDDGIEIGRRFTRGGSGLMLPALSATSAQVHEAVGALLGASRLREAAKRIKAEIQGQPTPVQVAGRLERLASVGELGAADLVTAAH